VTSNRYDPEAVDMSRVNPSSSELTEDMLQLALRMASEMPDEPIGDLEETVEVTLGGEQEYGGGGGIGRRRGRSLRPPLL